MVALPVVALFAGTADLVVLLVDILAVDAVPVVPLRSGRVTISSIVSLSLVFALRLPWISGWAATFLLVSSAFVILGLLARSGRVTISSTPFVSFLPRERGGTGTG